MANKYKQNADVGIVFINHMKGKLGEEVIKARLANLITEVDYIALKKIRPIQEETKYQNYQKPNWKVDDRVSHKDFGIGQVTHVFGSGDRLALAIKFKESSQKILDPKMARLVKVD
jgi:hypothetical protein